MSFKAESVWEFGAPNNVTFGVGAVTELADVVREFAADSALVITDGGVANAGILDDVTDALAAVEHTVFDGVEPDPSLAVYKRAVAVADEVEPACIVGVGGGSSMDVAKTVSVVHNTDRSVHDYIAGPVGGGEPIPGPGLPTVCLPTTAGTGSETSPVSVVSLPDQDLKAGISSHYQRPDLALVDPALTVSLPPDLTASSGMDALAHAIEAYVTRRYDAKSAAASRADRPDYNGRSAVTDLFARDAIERIGASLRSAVDNGEDLRARRNMALGSLTAGVAFTNAGLGATHALAMAAGAIHETPHGVTVGLLLPDVMRFNAPSALDRYADVARLLGEDVSGTSSDEAAEAAARAVEKLSADVGITGGLSTLGIQTEDVAHVAERANTLERLLAGNPRRVDLDDLEAILQNAV